MNIPQSWYPYIYGLAGALLAKGGDLVIARGTRRDAYFDGIRKDVADLRGELHLKDARIDTLEKDLDDVRETYRKREEQLYRRVGQLEGRTAELERYIGRAGLPVPAWRGEEKVQ